MTEPTDRLGVAIVGAGYWGPKLVRNFMASPSYDVRWVCDADPERAAKAVGRYSMISLTTDLAEVLDDPAVQVVALATPARTHAELALRCIGSGRHVLVEKPLAATLEEGRLLAETADDAGVVLMCDHTYCYTPPVLHMQELIASGEVGDVQYIDSVRINLGLVQRDVDVMWDLAPHDLSILDTVLPESQRPVAVSAIGADPVGAGRACVAYLTLPLAGGGIAHLHVNWLSPTKVRTTIVGGSRRMLVWDDLDPARRLSLYDRGVDVEAALGLGTDGAGAPRQSEQARISYRLGDMTAPALAEAEPLGRVVEELASAVREGRRARTDGWSGVRVLSILDAASHSLANGGELVRLDLPGAVGSPAGDEAPVVAP